MMPSRSVALPAALGGRCLSLKVIEKSRRTGITWAEASDNVLTAASSAPAGGMNVYYIAYNRDMTVEYIPGVCDVGTGIQLCGQ